MESFRLGKIHIDGHLVLAAVILLALSLRLFYFVGVSLNDDMAYIGAARQIATGLGIDFYPFLSNVTLRSLMILPIAAGYRLLGESEAVACAYPLLCSIITILLTFLLGRRLYGWQVGLGAALLMTFFPMNIVYSTQLVPQIPLACAVTASLLCLMAGDDLWHKGDRLSKRKGAFLSLVSGVLLGIGWMINEPAPFFLAVIALYPLSRKRASWAYPLFAVGALGVLFAECLAFKLTTGDPFWRFRIIGDTVSTIGTNTEMDYYPRAFFRLTDINFTWHEGHFGLFCYLFVLCSIFLLATWQKDTFFLLFGVWLILLYFQFGTMPLCGRPIAKWIRYTEMILPCATILGSLTLVRFGQMGKARWKGWVILSLFLASNLWFIPKAVEANRAYTRALRNTAEFLKELPRDKPVYSDKGATDLFSVYLGHRPYRRIEGRHFEAIHDAYAVINGTEYVIRQKITPFVHPEANQLPPAGWGLLSRIEPPWETIHGQFNPLVYFVPPKPVDPQGETRPDPEADVRQVAQAPELPPALLDILEASVGVSDNLLCLEMKLRQSPENEFPKHVQLAYLWVLDMDKDVSTGQRYGNVGSDLNVRISNERGFWQLVVDDVSPSDSYGYEDAPVWFRMDGSVLQARLPKKAFAGFGQFDWRALAFARTTKKPEQTLCYDLLDGAR